MIVAGGPNWFSTTAKNLEEYIRENCLDDSYLSNLKHMEKSKMADELECFNFH